jgi:histidinol-phosphate aminotransferase
MRPYSPPTAGRLGKLRLDFNENTIGTSAQVLHCLRQALDPSLLPVYPEYGSLRQALARHFKVAPANLLLTNGTDEAIQVFINTYIDDGAQVITLSPSYAMYRFYAELAGARVQEVRYRAPDLAFPLEELLERITEATRGVMIANPNNPTGTGTSRPGLEKILTRAGRAAVLVDEAYFEFCGVTALPLLETYPNLFVCRTFSKVYGLAAMRAGCLFSRRENVEFLRKAQSPYSVNTLAATAAAAAVKDTSFVRRYVAESLAARELLYAGFERLGITYYKSQANFVLFRAGRRAAEICHKLRGRGILVRDRSYELPGCVRVTTGTRAQARRFLQELERIWKA